MAVREGKAEIRVDEGVFYNQKMEFCRDFSSLAVGSLGGKLSILDGMCATGIRGIRYDLENDNVDSVVFVDLDSRACGNARHNAKKNRVKEFEIKKAELGEYLWGKAFGFIEIDPFGTPVPYLVPAARSIAMNGGGFLSVTATDVAVLCGAHYKACLKNYQARPLDNEYCHENASRILLGKIARCSSEYNLGLVPLATLSKQHYIKVIVGLQRGAEGAVSSIKKLGFMSHCPKCLWRKASSLVVADKCDCGGILQHAGPLWLGELHDAAIIKRMKKENESRGNKNSREIDSVLEKMLCEVGMPPAYYDLHRVSEVLGVSAERMDDVMGRLSESGFSAFRTHFKNNSIKTNAGIREVKEALLKASGSSE
jgi:tRNA (guanine26-N2/guanine27-N2)-dimethyltransferase